MCQGVPTHWHRRGVPSDFMRAFAPVTRDKRGAHLRFSGTHLPCCRSPSAHPAAAQGDARTAPAGATATEESPYVARTAPRRGRPLVCAHCSRFHCIVSRGPMDLTSRGRPLARSAELEAADMRNVHGGVCDGTACRYFSAQHALYCASTRGDVIAVVSMGTRWCRFLFRERSVCSRTLKNGSCLDSTAQDSLN